MQLHLLMACSPMEGFCGCNSLQCHLCSFVKFVAHFTSVNFGTVLPWIPVDDFFFDLFFCCRPCLHKKAPGGDLCSEGRVDVCSAQYSSDTFSYPFDIGVVIS